LNISVKELEITYKGETLGNEHSLEYIFKTRGVLLDAKIPCFKYRTKNQVHGIIDE